MDIFNKNIVNNRRKKGVENSEDVGRAESPENILDSHLEPFDETTKLNLLIHSLEDKFVKNAKKLVKLGIITAGLTALSPAAHSGQKTEQPDLNQTSEVVSPIASGSEHERSLEENKNETAAVLNKKLNTEHGIEIVDKCQSTRYSENVDSEAPLLMHIGQNHGSRGHFQHPETYISQTTASECIIKLIENNNTGKKLPIALEYVDILIKTPGLTREQMQDSLMKRYVRTALKKQILSRNSGRILFASEDEDSVYLEPFLTNGVYLPTTEFIPAAYLRAERNSIKNLFNGNPSPHPPQELYDLRNPLLDLVMHFDTSGEAERLINSEYLPGDFHASNHSDAMQVHGRIRTPHFDKEISDAADSVFSILKRIEDEQNVHIFMGDIQLSTPNDIYRADRDARALLQSAGRKNLSESDKKYLTNTYDLIFTRREKTITDKTMRYATEESGIDFGVILFGSMHDFRDEAEHAGANFLHAETAALLGVHNDVIKTIGGQIFDMPAISAREPFRREEIGKWVQERGGRERLLDDFNDGRWHDILFHNIDVLQDTLQYSSEELFSIIKKSFDLYSHSHGHDLLINPEDFEKHLSKDHFEELTRMRDQGKCDEHPEKE